MDKNECALFCFASHSKKRPHNLILGRTYDKHLLDMIEFGCSSVEGLENFKEMEKKRYGSKPCLVFVGEGWHQDLTLERVQNLFMGRGEDGGERGKEDLYPWKTFNFKSGDSRIENITAAFLLLPSFIDRY